MQDYKKLEVWQKSHKLAVDVYQVTANFPKSELFGLTSQICRACISIPSNIAEGSGRDGSAEFRRFLQMGFGSACELECQLLLSYDLKFIDEINFNRLNDQVIEVKRMIASLISKANPKTTKL